MSMVYCGSDTGSSRMLFTMYYLHPDGYVIFVTRYRGFVLAGQSSPIPTLRQFLICFIFFRVRDLHPLVLPHLAPKPCTSIETEPCEYVAGRVFQNSFPVPIHSLKAGWHGLSVIKCCGFVFAVCSQASCVLRQSLKLFCITFGLPVNSFAHELVTFTHSVNPNLDFSVHDWCFAKRASTDTMTREHGHLTGKKEQFALVSRVTVSSLTRGSAHV